MLTPQLWIELWHRAAKSEIGIRIETTNPEKTVQHLHAHRPQEFKAFTVCRTAEPNVIYIVKPGVNIIDRLPE